MSEFPHFNSEDLSVSTKYALDLVREQTSVDFVNINFNTEETPSILDSKLGGLPYVPEDFTIPKDGHDHQMVFLAQVNCSQVPANVCPNYPTKGILQWYISRDDDLYGLDYTKPNEQKFYRVCFHKTVPSFNADTEEGIAALAELEAHALKQYTPSKPTEDMIVPHDPSKSFKMEFEQGTTFITTCDVNFDPLFVKTYNANVPEEHHINEYWDLDCFDDVMEQYEDEMPSGQHQIGGYPTFIQTDPRSHLEGYKGKDFVLLQFCSDDSVGLTWGDCGMAQLMINQTDLLEEKFDKVVYNYDC